MGALSQFLDKYFGVKTRPVTHDITTGGAASITEAVPNNPDRLMLTIINLSANDVYAAPDTEPSITHGILLQSGGGTLSLQADADGALVGYDWHLYDAVGASVLFAIEMEGS